MKLFIEAYEQHHNIFSVRTYNILLTNLNETENRPAEVPGVVCASHKDFRNLMKKRPFE